jgi:hypothetical protein
MPDIHLHAESPVLMVFHNLMRLILYPKKRKDFEFLPGTQSFLNNIKYSASFWFKAYVLNFKGLAWFIYTK